MAPSSKTLPAQCRLTATTEDPDVSYQSPPVGAPVDPFRREGSQRSIFVFPETYNSFAPPSCFCRPESGPVRPPSESDEVLMDRYRTHMMPLFPFVIIPPTAQLQATKPFLFSALKMAASMNNVRSMQAQMYQIMRHIADYMLMQSERSLDLLQGLIVIIGQYHNHCLMHSQLSNLIHLARSLVSELGLNREPLLAERTKIMVLDPDLPSPRTNEERRALLGVWFLTSAISVGLQKIEAIRFSPYIQKCLKEIESAKELETDAFLAHLVRIQHLTEKIHDMNTRNDSEDMPGIPRAPDSAYRSAFQAELDRIQSSMSKSLKNNKLLITHVNTAILYLHQPPVLDRALLRELAASVTSLHPSEPSTLDILYRSCAALRGWFEHWFTVPTDTYHWLPLTGAVQSIYAVTMITRWARLVGPSSMPPRPEGPIRVTDPSARPPPRPSTLAPTTPAPTAKSASMTPDAPSPASASSALARLKMAPTIDPAIPAGVAALRARLLSQPGLTLDISGILATLGARLDAVHCRLGEMNAGFGDGEKPTSTWDLSAKKIMISRAKLERWAEIVAAGADAPSSDDDDEDDDEEDDEDGRGQRDMFGGVEFPKGWGEEQHPDHTSAAVAGLDMAMQGLHYPDPRASATFPTAPFGYGPPAGTTQSAQPWMWTGTDPWGGNFSDGSDPNFPFEGPVDWGAADPPPGPFGSK